MKTQTKEKPKFKTPQKAELQVRKRADYKKEKKEKEVTQYIQDFIPIKNIRNGIIETKDNRYVKILEIEPINFLLRSDEEQEDIIYSFLQWIKIANVKFQFKSITRRADSDRHIEMLYEDMAEEDNPKTIELAKSYIGLIKEVGTQEALSRRFFLVLEYEPFAGMSGGDSYTQIYQILQSAASAAKGYFAQCGNNLVVPKEENTFLGQILYMFFNRRSCIEEPFRDRVQRVVKDTMIAKGLIFGKDPVPDDIPVTNYIGPRGLDMSKSGYIIMDGLYYTFLFLKSNGYPGTVSAGWMSSLVNAGDGIDIDLHFKKEKRSRVLDDVSRKIRLNQIKMKETNDTSGDYEELRDSILSGYFIKDSLQSNNEDLFYISTLISINAITHEALIMKKKQLMDALRSMDMIASDTPFIQENALLSVMPLLHLDKDIYRKSKRNLLSSGVASTYMFTSFEMCDDNGILMGINKYNSSLCIVDIFNSKVYKNANITLLGTSGAGKTFTEQLMALRMRMRGIQCFIIAPLKGHEFRRACQEIGGTFIKLSAGSNDCINILQIRPADKSSDYLLEGEDNVEHDSELARKIDQLSIFFSLLLEDMTSIEAQIIDEALIQAYASMDITNDNSSLYEEDGSLKQMPTLETFYKIIENDTSAERIINVLTKFVKGSAQNFNKQTNVNLKNKYIVFDISELKGKMLPIGMFIALDYAWDKIKEDRTKKKAIFIDETWQLIAENKYAADFVLEIFKIIRGYGGAAIAATQNIGDFFKLEDGKYGRGIINNCKTKIILNLEPDEANEVKEFLRLSKTEIRNIVNFERGQALISTNNNKVSVTIKASETEKNLITTDRAELKQQADKKKALMESKIKKKFESKVAENS